VVNSAWLEARVRGAAPGLGSRLHRITNGVDLARFRPAPAQNPPGGPLRVLVVGRFRPEKNAPGLLEALARVRGGPAPLDAVVDWHGNDFFVDGAPSPRSDHYLDVAREVRARGMDAVFRLRPPVDDVVPLYQGADVVCLPSLYESFPNAVCEALACGRPVLASAVSDVATLVRDGENGFLFDPRDPGSIADALRRFAALDPEAREAMGRAGRARAEALLAPGTLEARWTGVIDAVLAARRGG
jgi:glycosyltransferase involved in cell wall biosynthesis